VHANFLSEEGLYFCGSAEPQSLFSCFDDGLNHLRVSVAKNHWPPRPDVINIALAVMIEEIRPFSSLKENGRTADALECSYRRVNTSGKDLTGAMKKDFRCLTHKLIRQKWQWAFVV
jgi:hypothetical protein